VTSRVAPTGSAVLNPTLSVQAFFSVPVAGQFRSTKFELRHHPDIAAWLLSFVKYLLGKQGKLPGDWQIADPPDGPSRLALIEGGVLLAAQRPDGGLALKLNPDFAVRLSLYARVRGEPARSALLNLGDDPDLACWLLSRFLDGGNRPDRPVMEQAPLTDTLVESLYRHGILVDELPAAEACFPDPDDPADLGAELAPASRVFLEPAGQAIPDEVRRILGRHTPALPPGRGLIWGQDAGTGMVYPALYEPGSSAPDIERITGSSAAERTALWDRQRTDARLSLKTRRYAVLREILPPVQREKLRAYVRQLIERGYFPALGDGQVALRSGIHNPPTVAALHAGLAGVVSSICGEPVIASYCYLSCYHAGAVLERHRDRPQCAYNLSLVLDMHGPEGEPPPWPIYVEIDGQPQAVLLETGDGVAYSGTEIWHWRDALPAGQRAVVCFFHFVPPDFTGSLD
jgi:hypothetical protein